jgi:hypothetical protein
MSNCSNDHLDGALELTNLIAALVGDRRDKQLCLEITYLRPPFPAFQRHTIALPAFLSLVLLGFRFFLKEALLSLVTLSFSCGVSSISQT